MNISDIAKMAGVSRAAVSRYFNQGYVSQEKRERIQKVIEQTGYVPSASAKALRTRKSNLIGVIVPKISSESVSKIVDGLGSELKERGYHMLLGSTDNDASQELEFIKVFVNNDVDGLVLIATELTKAHREMIDELPIPIVLIGQRLEGSYCVYHDDYHAARDLADCFFRSGVRRPCYIGVTEEDRAVGGARRSAFLDAAAKFQVPVSPEQEIRGAFTYQNGYEGMRKLLEQNPDTDGVFCVTDTIASGAMGYLREQGISVPDRMAVVGMGDSNLSRAVSPRLTTVRYFYQESGVKAAGILLELLEKKEPAAKEEILGYQIVRRESL